MIADLPPRSSSMCARPRTRIRPRPERYASRIPSRPRMIPPVGKSGPLMCWREPLDVDVGVVDHRDHGVDRLGEVVRRDVRRHPDCDAGGAVDEQVREPGRKHGGLALGAVVVRDEVDRVLVDVAQQLGGHRGEPRLGVALGGRRVAVDVAEVALRVDERVAERERLRHADEGVVDRLVAVRVVLPHHVADDAGALDPLAVRLQPELVHRVQHAAVHRLQPVPRVGKRARDDHAHRVVEEARAHLLLELARLDPACAGRFCTRHRALRTSRSAR